MPLCGPGSLTRPRRLYRSAPPWYLSGSWMWKTTFAENGPTTRAAPAGSMAKNSAGKPSSPEAGPLGP
eukprot:3821304-Lingulodinium_polyedra.AAC.1